jgi:hypothetical protein
LGTTEVVVPAVAVRHGSTALAGVLLGAISLGSGIGGLAYGQRTWRLTPMMRLVLHCGAMALICCLLGLATNPALLAAALGLLGLFLAPAMVTGYLLGDELTSESVRTEASTWINTALNRGVGARSRAQRRADRGYLTDAYLRRRRCGWGSQRSRRCPPSAGSRALSLNGPIHRAGRGRRASHAIAGGLPLPCRRPEGERSRWPRLGTGSASQCRAPENLSPHKARVAGNRSAHGGTWPHCGGAADPESWSRLRDSNPRPIAYKAIALAN